MLTETVDDSLKSSLDNIFDNDETIITLACIRIDGPIFYIKNRINFKNQFMHEAKLSALALLIKNLSSHLLNLNGDADTRFISFNNLDKKITLGILDFFIVFVQTDASGNAKGIAKHIAAMTQ